MINNRGTSHFQIPAEALLMLHTDRPAIETRSYVSFVRFRVHSMLLPTSFSPFLYRPCFGSFNSAMRDAMDRVRKLAVKDACQAPAPPKELRYRFKCLEFQMRCHKGLFTALRRPVKYARCRIISGGGARLKGEKSAVKVLGKALMPAGKMKIGRCCQ